MLNKAYLENSEKQLNEIYLDFEFSMDQKLPGMTVYGVSQKPSASTLPMNSWTLCPFINSLRIRREVGERFL